MIPMRTRRYDPNARYDLRAVICAGLLAAGACVSLDSPGAINTLAINMFIDKPTIVPGDSATISITATNFGNNPVTLSAPGGCYLFIEVHSLNGVYEYGSGDSCRGTITTATIDPGKEMMATIHWDGRTTAGPRLNPGPYTMRAAARLTDRSIVGGGITVTVAP
jgi:Intracellular proteinase inhibitor